MVGLKTWQLFNLGVQGMQFDDTLYTNSND